MVAGESFLRLAQNFDSVDARQNDVEQREVGLVLGDRLQRFFATGGKQHFVALGLQGAPDGAQRKSFVIDDQNGMRHG